MKISAISNNQQKFGQLLVSTDGMGAEAKYLANKLEQQISYSPNIDILDRNGVDVVIFADSKSPVDRAKVAFVTHDNKLFKDNKNDHIKTIKDYDIGTKTHYYGTNSEKVLDFIQQIINGDVKTTKRKTNTLKELLQHFPLRANNIFKY